MAADLFSLKDQIILVTGSSRGLGWVMARTMAEAGARVILNGRDQKLLQQRLVELQQANLQADLQSFDVADSKAVMAGIQSIAERYGRLDGLVNNAAIQHRKPIQEFELSDYDRLMDTNLRSCFASSLDETSKSSYGLASTCRSHQISSLRNAIGRSLTSSSGSRGNLKPA